MSGSCRASDSRDDAEFPPDHLGHLVQIPTGEADVAAALDPVNWTVFNEEKAREAAAASRRSGVTLANYYRPLGTLPPLALDADLSLARASARRGARPGSRLIHPIAVVTD